jgi:ferredoxin
VFFARKFSGPRWLPWVSGIVMLALVWFIGWTGYWLVWDQPAQQVAVSSMQLLDGLPIFGEPMARLYVSDRTVPSLLFFVVFFLHMLLPLGIAVGLAVHLMRVSRSRLLPNRALSLALLGGMALASIAVPAPLDAPARMAVKATNLTVDAWYLSPLALGLRFQHAGLWIALFGGTALGALVPWLLGRRRPAPSFQATIDQSRCHACTQCVQDCPFDAITMVPRTDGKRRPSQAEVDPARCVGCGVCGGSCDSEGLTITWFDTRVEEARIEREIAEARARGGLAWVALVSSDIEGGYGHGARGEWERTLAGYDVHFVPTASWVRPKFVEQLFATGTAGVLVVRDARAEAWGRDGGRWVAERLEAKRHPEFRSERGGNGAWCVVDFDPARPEALARTAAEFRAGTERGLLRPQRSRVMAIAAGIGLAALIGAATVAPSHLRVTNPASSAPELVVSFKALGAMVEPAPLDPAQEAAKPVHMRGRATDKPHRAPVLVRLTIDGQTRERSFAGKGISHDGPAIDEWRVPMAEGEHQVTVEIVPGPGAPALRWSGPIRAVKARLAVISYDPSTGFVVE